MIQRGGDWNWPEVELQTYKDEPGTWMSVTRRTLLNDSETAFEMRYFELSPNGYTSFEQHCHEHNVLVIRGRGRVRLGERWHDLNPSDAVRVPGKMPHQFHNPYEQPFGIVCIVDRERDRPILLDTEPPSGTSD